MSGTPKGKIECLHNTGNMDTNCQEMFVNIYANWKILEAAGYTTEIANNYGNGGTGFDYHDGANPTGDNAFFVFKMNLAGSGRTYVEPYVLFQYSSTSNFGSAPGNPGLINATVGTSGFNIGIAIAFAFEADGTTAANPWKGGTAKAGSDSKGTPVWSEPGGGTVHVFPRSNNQGGSHNVNKENCTSLFYSSASGVDHRVGMVGDKDFWVWFCDSSDTGEYNRLVMLGQFTPRANTTWDHPMMFYADQADCPPTTGFSYGNTAGSGDNQGAVMLPSVSDGVRAPIRFSQIQHFYDTAVHPNTVVNEFDEMPIPFAVYEGAYQGFCGQLPDVVLQVYNIANSDTNTGKTRIVLSNNLSLAVGKVTVPWDGTTTPRSGVTRQGVDF